MLLPASPRIAASFASSPGRSGTSMSIWIMSPREGHGSARLQALRAVAWRQIAYGTRSPHSSEFMRFTLAYVGIQVRDLERSISFYRDVLGMRVARRRRVPETGGEWAELRSAGSKQLLELNWYPDGSKFFAGPYRNGDELDHIAFACADVGRAYRELVAKGARRGHSPLRQGGSMRADGEERQWILVGVRGW